MARLWMTVFLVLLLAPGPVATVDTTMLANLIQRIKQEYQVSTMFSLALSLQDGNPDNLEQIIQQNQRSNVDEAISRGEVYRLNAGARLAMATVKQPEHAELRVLKGLKLDSDKNDLLVIYSYASSCPTSCTKIDGPHNIITQINDLINTGKWKEYAFVFEKIFKPKNCKTGLEVGVLKEALKNLGTSRIKLPNIFRCYKPGNKVFQCISCSSSGDVTPQCVDYNA